MKKYLLISLFVPLILTGCLRSLEKEGITAETTYKGRVIDKSNKPLNGIIVRVTNGSLNYNSVTTDMDGIFQITVDINKIDKTYYIQIGEENSFSKKSQLKGFGQSLYDYGDIPFANINIPVVETVRLTDMTANSFTVECNVTSQGGAVVTERGLCWGTNIPTIADHKESSGSGEGSYTCTITNQDFNFTSTTYYARAYAINEYGESYGDVVEISPSKYAEFMTKKLPKVTTVRLTDMAANSFTVECNVTSQGGAVVTERGLCWGTNIPTIADHKESSGSGEGSYTCTITNVDFSAHTYYARAYAINEYGVSYGDAVEINNSKLAYFSLPSMQYGGYTYHIHPDLGAMQWEQANAACESLVAYGYDDWYLPNKEELLAVATSTTFLDKTKKYWSTTKIEHTHNCYILYYSYSWTLDYIEFSYSGNLLSTIPVRKDR